MPVDYEEILRRAAQPTREALDRRAAEASAPVRRMIEHIRDHFFDPDYSVGKLLRATRASNAVRAQFRAETGMPPWAQVTECRMEMMVRLFRDTLFSVEQVACFVGYSSRTSFTERCKAWCGLSPSSLRDALRAWKQKLPELPEKILTRRFLERTRASREIPEELRLLVEERSE